MLLNCGVTWRGGAVWATQLQVVQAFDMDVRTVNEHIKNVYKTEELDEKSTIRKFRIVQIEGNREVEREINHYNLDMILAVGYRVNSKKATTFRQWATKTLREHITKGYTINRKRIGQNYDAFIKAVGGRCRLCCRSMLLSIQKRTFMHKKEDSPQKLRSLGRLLLRAVV